MLADILTTLKAVPDEVWDTYALRNEPLKYKLAAADQADFLQLAHRTGIRLAHRVWGQYPDQSLSDIYRALGIQLHELSDEDGGHYTMFACYTEPDKVELYTETIRLAEESLREENCTAVLAGIQIRDILLAHELFHYYECTLSAEELPTKQKLLTLWHIGRFQYKSSIISLNEIAAMAFAKEYLSMPYSPYILDVLLLYHSNRRMAMELYEYICKL